MKGYWIVALIACLVGIPTGNSASANIIVNGDFSAGLSDWDFNDMSYKAGVSWPDPWSEAYVEAEEAVIHGHYAYGQGALRQDFSSISPTYFSFWWDLDGTCSYQDVYLLDAGDFPLEDPPLRFRTHSDSLVGSYNETLVSVAGSSHEIISGAYLDEGVCEVRFDDVNSLAEFRIDSGGEVYEFSLALPEDYSVSAVVLWANNTCFDGRNDTYGKFDDLVLTPEALAADIDIKPGSLPNSVNPISRGVLPVAILGAEDFNVFEIDLQTVELDGTGPRPKGSGETGAFEDINGDMIIDLVLHFNMEELGIEGDANQLTLTGLLQDGLEFEGSDSIRIVPPGDMDGDGLVTADDIGLFVLAMADADAYAASCGLEADIPGDCDGDGSLTSDDIQPFVALLTGGAAIPEPAVLSLLAFGGLVPMLSGLKRKRKS